MAKSENLFEKILVEPLSKFANFRVVRSISSGFQLTVGLLMVGAFLSFVSTILGFIPSMAESEFLMKFNIVKELTFGIMGILFAYGIAAADAKITKVDQPIRRFMLKPF